MARQSRFTETASLQRQMPDTTSSKGPITRAVPSPDGLHIAEISSSSLIQITQCPSSRGPGHLFAVEVTSKPAQRVLANTEWIRWSPDTFSNHFPDPSDSLLETSGGFIRAWLLISDGRRLINLCIDLDSGDAHTAKASVVGDFDLGTNLGRFSFIDFVFGHEHAIVIDALATQASIICLTRPERLDVANVKFADHQGLAFHIDRAAFAVLTRMAGQDCVTVFTMSELDLVKSNSFSPHTIDAQNITWSPGGSPLICVSESASFGLKISFFAANGHHLKHMDLSSENVRLSSLCSEFEGLGVNTLDWTSVSGEDWLVVFDNSGQLVIKRLSGMAELYSSLTVLQHQSITDGSAYPIWQESSEGLRFFSQIQTSFEPRPSKRLPGGDLAIFNTTQQILASKDSSRPWTLWIWDVPSSHTFAVVNFLERVKQIFWHPQVPEMLFVATSYKQPILYVWHALEQDVRLIEGSYRDLDQTSGEYEFKWLGNTESGQPLLLISSPTQFDIGVIDIGAEPLTFRSVLHDSP